jgi:hypothetical protein
MFEREIADCTRDYMPDDMPEIDREISACRVCGAEPRKLIQDNCDIYRCSNPDCDNEAFVKCKNGIEVKKLWNRLNRDERKD